jgi:hypothetical protein
MLSADESAPRNQRGAVTAKSGEDRPHDEDSQLALEVQALAELLLDIFEYKQGRKKASIACSEAPFLDAASERHTI